MDKKALAAGWVTTIGILFIVLGIVHCAVTPIILQRGFDFVPPDVKRGFIFMYLATGAATMFCGWLETFAARGLRKSDTWAWPLAWRVALFLSALGIGAVIAMYDDPFAYLMLLFAAALLVPLTWYRPEFKRPRYAED